MTPAARRRLTLTTLVLVEGYFYVRYAAAGAQFHFWLHALLGGALGLGLLTLARLVRPREARPWSTHEAGLAGHLYSAAPDVLFLTSGVLHAAWMDVFALHISAHFLWPGPLLAAFLLWALVVGGWTAERLGARRLAAGGLLAATVLLAAGVALRSPVPSTLQDVVEGGSNGPDLSAWVCRVDL